MQYKLRRSLHPQQTSSRNPADLAVDLPHFDYRPRMVISIALRNRLNEVKDPVVDDRA